MTSTERDEERRLAADVVTIRTQVEQTKALPKPDAARFARLQQALTEAVEKRHAVRHEIFARLP